MLQEHRKYLSYYNVLGKRNLCQKMSELPDLLDYTRFALACGRSISNLLSQALKPNLVYHLIVS